MDKNSAYASQFCLPYNV